MRAIREAMGMPISVEIVDSCAEAGIEDTFSYFTHVDERFSTYKSGSEISRINRGELTPADASAELQEVFALAEQTKQETRGYFDSTQPSGLIDPSGIVKGWAVWRAAEALAAKGYQHFCIDAGGDIQSAGKNAGGADWSVGIRNPFKTDAIVKVIRPRGAGVATSGSYARGAHIYNPHDHAVTLTEIVSLTVVGENVLEADRFATAAFAMGRAGIAFVEERPGLEGYAIDRHGIATMTSGLTRYAL